MSDLSQESPVWREYLATRATIATKDDEIDRLRAEVAGKDAQIARLREALGVFMEWWDTESAGPQYSTADRRDAPGGELEWHVWWSNQLRLAALAPELGRAALAPVEVSE